MEDEFVGLLAHLTALLTTALAAGVAYLVFYLFLLPMDRVRSVEQVS